MAKITVESLAKQLKVSSQEVLKCLESIGVFVPNAKATMELDEIRKVCVKLTGKEPRFKRPASKTAAQAKPVKTAEKKENPAKEEEKNGSERGGEAGEGSGGNCKNGGKTRAPAGKSQSFIPRTRRGSADSAAPQPEKPSVSPAAQKEEELNKPVKKADQPEKKETSAPTSRQDDNRRGSADRPQGTRTERRDGDRPSGNEKRPPPEYKERTERPSPGNKN